MAPRNMLASADAGAQCRQRCAVIVGGSMSGLLTAAFLRQTGWEVDVYERSRNWVGRGAGIVSQPELIEALEKSARKPRRAAARQHLNGYFGPS